MATYARNGTLKTVVQPAKRLRLRAILPLTLATLVAGCGDSSSPSGSGSMESPASVSSSVNQPASTIPRFTDIAASSGIDFVHYNGATADKFFPEIMGSGGAFLDYDNDGDLDVLVVQSGRINDTTDPLFPVVTSNNHISLYRNDLTDGLPAFVDVTDQSGLKLRTYGMGVAVGDLNNDGLPDVYVTDLNTNALFMNNGDGSFRQESSGVSGADAGWFTSASFLDYDLDGNLDVFAVRYVDVDLVDASHIATRIPVPEQQRQRRH